MTSLTHIALAAQTVHRFFHHLDEKQFDQVAAMFAEHGIWVRQAQSLEGPTSVLKALQDRPAQLSTRHLVTNLLVEETNMELEARYYVTVFDHAGSADVPAPLALPQSIFVCCDRLIETPHGLRFASRRPRLVFKRS